MTLVLETLAYLKWFTFPSGVTATAVALVASILVFFVVSWLGGPEEIDEDIGIV